MSPFSALDRWFPPAGACAFCGHADKRHRLWDALLGMLDAGDDVATVAGAYGLPVEAVEAVRDARPYPECRE